MPEWEGSIKMTTYEIFIEGEKEQLIISHNMKTKVTTIRLGKSDVKVRGKKLTDKELFPITLIYNEKHLTVKITLYDVDIEDQLWFLLVNGVQFEKLPYCAPTRDLFDENLTETIYGNIMINDRIVLDS